MPSKITGYPTAAAEPLSPLQGRGANAQVVDKSQGNAAVQGNGADSGADQVTLTGSARALQKLSDIVASTPVIDAGRVAAVKQSLQNGSYQVDLTRVANGILNFENNLKK